MSPGLPFPHARDRKKLVKQERLKSHTQIKELFVKGSSLFSYPLLLKYTYGNEKSSCHKIVFSVSKKKHKKAVDRNRVKRLIREAYRLNKHQLYENKAFDKPLNIAIIYTAEEILSFEFVQNKLNLVLKRLVESKVN